MSDQAFTRRSSYGPSSPTIGSRGARTRQQILEAALVCFTRQGFHATSVEDIATAADTSRATLYQYFESKDAVFTELMYESGTTLIRVARNIGRLGPHAEGFRTLAIWVRDWTANFERFAPMFVEWTNVLSPASPLRPELTRFTNAYAEKVGKELRRAGQADGMPEQSAILCMALLTRFNYIRHVYRPGLTDRQFLASLTIALQIYLFPDTPVAVLAADPLEPGAPSPAVEAPPVADIGPLATLPPRESIVHPDPFAGLSPHASVTARQLLDAACRVFAANGFNASNIDQVVAEAGLARGTFYRYFTTKLDLLTALAWEASALMCPLFDELADVAGDPEALRAWLARFLDVQQRYTGVLRAWSEGFPVEPAMLGPAADVVISMSGAITRMFGPERPFPLARRAAGMLLSGLLEHFPNEGVGTQHEPTDAEIIAIQANFIERVLLPR